MRRLLLLVGAIVFVDTMFFAALTPLLPQYAEELGLSKAGAGLLAASYALGALVGGIPGGISAARFGVRPTVLVGLTGMAITTVTFGFADSIWLLDTARFLQGVASSFSWTASLAWLVAAAPADRRGETIGAAMGAAIVGALFGPVLGGIASVVGTGPAFASVAVLASVLGVAAWRTPAYTPEHPQPLSRLFGALRDRAIVASIWFVLVPALLFGALNVLGPLRLDVLGLSALAIGATWLVAASFEAAPCRPIGEARIRRDGAGEAADPGGSGTACGSEAGGQPAPPPDALSWPPHRRTRRRTNEEEDMRIGKWLGGTLAALTLAMPLTAAAQGELVLYCTVQEEWCRPMVAAFERTTGIKVLMTRKSSGEFYAQIKAEAANPRGDIWWGGTGDPHLQAAEEGLTEAYRSPRMVELQDWAAKQWESSKGRTVGVYAGALGYSFNADQLRKKNIAEPKCWADLTRPEFKDEIQVANPNSSGTSYTMLATFVQLMGEDKAFEFMKAMHRNVNQYTKSGAAPARAAATGESLIGITFQHDAVVQAIGGAPVKIVSPCEGTGYEIGSMSIIKGAKNMENARKWYDWALSPEAQGIGAQNKVSYQVPSNKSATVPAQAPKLTEVKLINYDFAKYGSSAERNRLLKKWDAEIGALPK